MKEFRIEFMNDDPAERKVLQMELTKALLNLIKCQNFENRDALELEDSFYFITLILEAIIMENDDSQ